MPFIKPNIHIDFTEQTEVGEFSDALIFSPEEYALLTEDDINAKIQERVAAHVDRIKNPPPQIVLSEEEKAEWIANMKLQLKLEMARLDNG